MGHYLYFNKQTFRELIKVWRMLGCDKKYLFNDITDEKLMDYYMPIRFVDDIKKEVYDLKRGVK